MSHAQYQTAGAIDRLSQYLEELPHSQFRTTLLAVNRKFLPALRACKKSQREYYFYICDHIEAINRATEAFGPVPRPQFIRDPTAASWIMILVEPILLFALDESIEKPLNAARTAYYTEICMFLSATIAKYRKLPCFYKDFVESIWDILTEVLQETDQSAIRKYTFNVLQVILSRVPLCEDLVCKVVLLRATTLGFNCEGMVEYRLLHCRMFHLLVARAIKASNQQYLDDLRAEIVRCITSESDQRVMQTLLKVLSEAKMPEQAQAAHTARSLRDFESVDDFFDNANYTGSSIDESVAQLVVLPSSIKQPSLRSNRSAVALRKPSPLVPPRKLAHAPRRQNSWLSLSTHAQHDDPADTSVGYKEFDESLGRSIVKKLRQWRSSVFTG